MFNFLNRCKHDWEVKSEEILPPKFKLDNCVNIKFGREDASDLLSSTHIIIMACKKCGKIYKSVESN